MTAPKALRAGQRTADGAEVVAYFETEEYSIVFSLANRYANIVATVSLADGSLAKTLRQDDNESGRRFYMRVIRDALTAA